MRDEGEAKVGHEENDGADTQRLGKEPAVIQPEGESFRPASQLGRATARPADVRSP